MRMSRIQFQFLIIATILGLVYLKYRNYNMNREQHISVKEIDSEESKTSRIQQTAEFRRAFGDRIDSLTSRKAAARDPELVQLVREMMIPPFPVSKIRTNNATQINELVLEVDNLLESKKNGFYIECGALDGEKASNTIFFEQQRGWNGLLIEMDPEYFTEILTKRRRAWTINACVSPFDYAIKLPFKGKGRETPQLLMDKGNLEKNSSQFAACFPLETFLLALDAPEVDFFCFDIEGLELKILQTFPFDRIDMNVLSVECLKGICNEQECKEFMQSKGYNTHKFIDIQAPGVFMRDFVFHKRTTSALHKIQKFFKRQIEQF